MTEMTLNRMRAAVIAVAPVVLLIGFIVLPYVSNFTDEKAFADAVGGDETRLIWATIILGAAMGLTLAAVFAIRMLLKDAGENMWSPIAVFLIAVGGALIAVVGVGAPQGLAFGIQQQGANAEAIAKSFNDWFVVQIVAGIIFGLGWLSLAAAIYRALVLSQQLTWLVIIAIVVSVVANFVPTGWALYVVGVSAIVALWPLAMRVMGPAGVRMPMARPARP